VNRLYIWLGPAGTVVMFIGLAVAGLAAPPAPDAALVLYAEHREAMQVGLVIAMIGGALYLPWLAMMARACSRADRDRTGLAQLQMAFGVIFVILVEFPYLLLEVAIYRPENPAPVVQALADTAWVMAMGFGYTHVVAVLLIGVVMVRERRALDVFPRWFGWLNIVCALASVPSFFAGVVPSGVMAWNGLVAFGSPSVAFFPWLIAWTVVLLRLERQPASARQEESAQ
jgi:hypothetical protein